MSQLIHVGSNKLKSKQYTKILNEIDSLFKEHFPEPATGYFQHIPLDALKPKGQQLITDALKDDVMEYAYNYLTPPGSNQPLFKLSGLGDVKIVRQAAYNKKLTDPDWEFEANGLNNLSSSITIIWHLNSIEEDGELEFLFQGIRIRPQQEEVVIFPSYYTHSHKLNPATEEKTFLITTFYLGG